ncbi:DEAD/DEAH box helicase [Paenibacillus sp. HB172176]|uniref:DEAD/DEAH box helicase n=1 Tax=Paenibacillus sp. HB172176 TaxID=2493690 RepID=UPI001438FE2F|nr:DEAD/DEAH box helicase [Paenibacillus sp. HB172176]
MRGLTNIRSLKVDGHWSQEENRSCLVLFGDDQSELSEGRLRSLLFGWHKASWYGTEVEEDRRGGVSFLRLTPLQAVDYMWSPAHVQLLQIKWSERLSVLMRAAAIMRAAMIEGWFLPDWSKWSEEERGWKLAFPKEREELSEQWETVLLAAREHGDANIDAWLGAAIEEIMSVNPDAAKAWQAIGAKAGDGVLRHKGGDEEEWLIAIGLEKDTLPFRIALQLTEPQEETGWELHRAIQDREGGSWMRLQQRQEDEAFFLLEKSGEEAAAIPEGWQPLLPEKLQKETAKWLLLLPHLEDGPQHKQLREKLTEQEAWEFLEKGSIKLLEAGSAVLLPAWWEAVRSRKLRLKAKLKSSVGSSAQPMFGLNQIMQFDWKLALGNLDLTESQFLQMAEENKRLFRVGEEWVHLDPKDVAQIKEWMKRVGKRKGLSFRDVLEMHLRGGSELDISGDLDADLQAEVELNEHLTAWLQKLQHISQIPLIDPPASFLGELRPYQQQGLSWMLFLRQFGLGGVLADDMGLGKTIQFMAYLICMKEACLEEGPSLLICPTSVIGNWEKELAKFAPSLKVLLHYGSKRLKGEELRDDVQPYDLVITSYSLAQLDEEDLCAIDWNALCLDEAQNIKNVYTKQSGAIRRLSAKHRLALTGTPMENRLTELWSIYDFINPGYLGSLHDFRKAVVAPIERSRDEKLIQGLQSWVKPFMLRRVKKDPAIQLSLPDKIESKSYMNLTAEQGALYENTVSDLMEKLDTLGAMQRRGLILATLTKLKQLCDHPALMLHEDDAASWTLDRSGKMARLLEMCEEIAAEGERCLIFTQYVEMGSRLQAMLERELGMPVPYLHGGVPKGKRDEMITRFQSEAEPCPAFVLSLKAGGTGLNLTAANHVFHFDRWWNPAVENQATDRAFRIGQTKQVQVHKFITLGTLEEKIDEMIESKQSLNEQVVGQSDNWITELNTDELRELFALRDGWLKG